MGKGISKSEVNLNKSLANEKNEINCEIKELFNELNNEYNFKIQKKYCFGELEYDKSSNDVLLITAILDNKDLSELTNRQSRALGCFICSAIGDALGAHTEFQKINYENYHLNVRKFEDLKNVKPYSTNFNLKIGEISDDTSMALCLADSLFFNNKKLNSVDLRIRFFLWWHYGYNNCRKSKISNGLGGNISESFKEFFYSFKKNTVNDNFLPSDKENERNGNGSLMRLAPLPIAFANENSPRYIENIKLCIKYAKLQSLTTHNGREAYQCCMILAYLLIKNINYDNSLNDSIDPKIFIDTNMSLEDLQNYIDEPLEYSVECLIRSEEEDGEKASKFIKEGKYSEKFNSNSKDRNWNWRSKHYRYSPTRSQNNPLYIGSYCMDALTMALHCVYHSKTNKEAILKAINMGGDADTVGAITGQIAGSIWGLDKEMLDFYDYVRKFDNNKIAIIAYKLFK